VLRDLGLEASPVPAARRGCDSPHVKLEDSLAHWRAGEGLVWALLLSQLHGSGNSAKVNGLKNVSVEL